ncbi:TIGR00366 family protein [Synergistaceae bacterium OttesenSCG-928-I11]|nr:TIGR00366 family protein [Synergistaceae bacterium OttesenSCG-928-I11]
MKLFKKFPNTAALLLIIIFLCAVLTYVVPAGEFERKKDEASGRTLVVAGTFHYVDQQPIGPGELLAALFNGLLKASDIIAFIFVIGGSMAIVVKSGAINAALGNVIKKHKNKTQLLIPVVMIAFAFAGATFGMAEETLPFVAILIAAAMSMGYDRLVGVCFVTIGVYAGYSAGPLNPFSIGIAHTVAELPLFSGMGLRTVLCVGGALIAIHHTMAYAAKVKADPSKSLVADIPFNVSNIKIDTEQADLTGKDKAVLFILVATLGALVVGVLKFGWYLEEISALFLLMGIVTSAITFGPDVNVFADEFMDGARELTGAALLVGFSRAVLVVMESGMIMDTIIYALSLPLAHFSNIVAAWGMFFVQGLINFFIPSSSGQAVVVMPIMAPLSDLIGISRQIACQAYQAGDGYWNMITPTHPVLMASLGIAGIPFARWFKFAFPLVLKWCVWTCIILAVGVYVW